MVQQRVELYMIQYTTVLKTKQTKKLSDMV